MNSSLKFSEVFLERVFEDHQKLTEAILMWPTISSNRLGFSKRLEKYGFLRTMNSYEQFFSSPNIEGNIYFKEKSRKSWKKYFCVLRSSGLYFIPKGKGKVRSNQWNRRWKWRKLFVERFDLFGEF